MIAIALQDGTIQTYTPRPSDPTIHSFGRFRWVTAHQIHCTQIFYQAGEVPIYKSIASPETRPGEAIVLSFSYDAKLLVAHRNQLAVFDTNPHFVLTSSSSHSSSSSSSSYHQREEDPNKITTTTTTTTTAVEATIVSTSTQSETNTNNAQILWTTTLTDSILTAQISGDGQSLAVVTQNNYASTQMETIPGIHDTSFGNTYSQDDGDDYQCGVQIFIRDRHDGSTVEESTVRTHQLTTKDTVLPVKMERSLSAGILYRTGPFLVHSAPVSRLSFRGQGHNTSNTSILADDQGNDLLLTYCKQDCTARIFNQNSWKQLVEWTTPPDSRVDWVRGIAAFSLGDLETQKRMATKPNENTGNAPASDNPMDRRDSFDSLSEMAAHGGRQLQSSASLHSTPSSAAGAWISELTFRNAFPALRLSRLSYLKRGSESIHPALFESVATILPAGSIIKDAVLANNANDETFSLHGIWPAWNPWLSETSSIHSDETLRGSAMSFLGLSSGPPSSAGGYFGDGLLGGTHSPPCEVRIVSSHPFHGNNSSIVLLEIPLWGDRDQGELELGRALRYVLSLSDIDVPVLRSTDQNNTTTFNHNNTTPLTNKRLRGKRHKRKAEVIESTNYESDRLVARIRPDSQSVAVTWRKQGTMSVVPSSWTPEHFKNSQETPAIATTLENTSYDYCGGAQRFQDVSVLPIPLSLPPLCLPRSATRLHNETIEAIKWWPDENFGGPPHLLVVTAAGTIILFEIPPPWSALEPAMPPLDPILLDSTPSVQGPDGSIVSGAASMVGSDDDSDAGDDYVDSERPKRYDVMITPHPDFGLGLRLESQMDGLPAVAGSYKKHPLTGGMLPAEKVGMIVLGDELISVNGVSLEGITFDEIISTVRQVASSSPGKPLTMRFRSFPGGRRGRLDSSNSVSVAPVPITPGDKTPNKEDASHSRRSMEKMLGVSPKQGRLKKTYGEGEIPPIPPMPGNHRRTRSNGSVASFTFLKRSNSVTSDAGESYATMLVGADMEIQQEFCRITAVVPCAIPSLIVKGGRNHEGLDPQSCLVLIPWTTGVGTPHPKELRGAALLFSSEGGKIHATRLEVALDCNPDKAKVITLGSYDLNNAVDDGDKKGQQQQNITIRSMSTVEWGTDSDNCRCLAIYDNHCTMRFVCVTIEKSNNDDDTNNRSDDKFSPPFAASFRHYRIFRLDGNNTPVSVNERIAVRASSVDLMATMHRRKVMDGTNHQCQQVVTVWSARPHPTEICSQEDGDLSEKGTGKESNNSTSTNEFAASQVITIDRSCSSSNDDDNNEVIDFCFVQSGFLDSSPLFVVFTRAETIVYQRLAGTLDWKPIVELSYAFLAGSTRMSYSSSYPCNKKLHFGEAELTATFTSRSRRSPIDTFPHLLPTLQAILPSYDELKCLRADWHPDSLVAHICTEEQGAKSALKRHVRNLFKWLSEAVPRNTDNNSVNNNNEADISAVPSDATSAGANNLPASSKGAILSFPPIRSVFPSRLLSDDKMDVDDDHCDDDDEEDDGGSHIPTETAASLFAMTTTATTTATTTDAKKPENNNEPMSAKQTEKQLLQKLQSVLENNSKDPIATSTKSAYGKHFDFANHQRRHEEDPMATSKRELPVALRSLTPDELYMLWALGEVVLKPPRFKSLDLPGQMFVFAMTLYHKIMKSESLLQPSGESEGGSVSPRRDVLCPAILSKHTSSSNLVGDHSMEDAAVASAGCFAALLSDCQGQLLEACRRSCGGKITVDLDFLVKHKIPFWIRSDSVLANLAEEVGQNVYKKGRDVLECALFFILAGKLQKLKNLAATDMSNTGSTFRTFVNNHDFKSERGRRAAEKNAFSLLRKRRYKVAAAFFLLAEPPILKPAVEVIATQMKNLDLAFMVLRLMNGRLSATNDNSTHASNDALCGFNNNRSTFSGLGLGSGLGGGGYASSGMGNLSSPIHKDEEPFKDWKPNLGVIAKEFLQERALAMSDKDNCLVAIQLVWLHRREEASWCLTGLSGKVNDNGKEAPPTIEIGDSTVPKVFHRLTLDTAAMTAASAAYQQTKSWEIPTPSSQAPSAASNESLRVLAKSNALIDFVSGPMLLKTLNASTRARFSSALIVSGALMKCGIDLPSIRALLQNVKPCDLDKENIPPPSSTAEQQESQDRKVKMDSAPSAGEMSSSIFDSFDAAPHLSKPQKDSTSISTTSEMQSSIFSDFDPPPKQKHKSNDDNNTPQAASGSITSSIFDAFDVPPPPRNYTKTVTTQPTTTNDTAMTGNMNSSIFDSFDVAPPKPPTAKNAAATSAAANGAMNSSIFDGFDPAPKPPQQQNNIASPASGTMNSSIFDSFDGPPKTASQSPQLNNNSNAISVPSGTMNSSIFDSFDGPPKPVPTKPAQIDSALSSGAMNSSIFDSFDGPPKPSLKSPHKHSNNVSSPTGTMNSSIFDSFDTVPSAAKKPPTAEAPTIAPHPQEAPDDDAVEIQSFPTPKLWLEWRQQILVFVAARRLLREVSSEIAELYGDAIDPPIVRSRGDMDPLIPFIASEVLQLPCEADNILNSVRAVLDKNCKHCQVEQGLLIQHALHFLSSPLQHHRMFLAVLLNLVSDRVDLAEDLVRDAAQSLINRCNSLAFCNDDLLHRKKTLAYISNQHLRRHAARLSWQLELCLWLHRGGGLPLSGTAMNEAVAAVRIGLVVASWNNSFECLETMIRCEPDCLLDVEAGRQLWTSLKMISRSEKKAKASGGTGSGGWEFLVDCRRSEATEILRNKPTGCFIIRPHAEDHGVFTLSFKTNLVPTEDAENNIARSGDPKSDGRDDGQQKGRPPRPGGSRPVRKDDVVQHAIIRLSDSGFRCGSFGPFATLMKLLEAVSSSLPFQLRFDLPPKERVILDEGSQPSPNSVFLRKMVLRHADGLVLPPAETEPLSEVKEQEERTGTAAEVESGHHIGDLDESATSEVKYEILRKQRLGLFLELLVLSSVRKQLSSVVSAEYENLTLSDCSIGKPQNENSTTMQELAQKPSVDSDSDDSSVSGSNEMEFGDQHAIASRILRPLLTWCRMLETCCESQLTPPLREVSPEVVATPQITLSATETAIEATNVDCGDSLIRCMIQPNSGVEFRTLKLSDGAESTLVILFSKKEAVDWLMNYISDKSLKGAMAKLDLMEKKRVIEPIDLSKLQLKAYTTSVKNGHVEEGGVRYRFVDPWEVEALESREGETKSASIGRERFLAFSLGRVAGSCENVFRSLGGLPVLELWTTAKGGVALTKAIASVHPTWERGSGGDLQLIDGGNMEPSPFINSIRQHLYRNSLFRRISLPQRFLALIQVELLDLKNLTAPGGSSSLTVYSLLRLRRSDSRAPLTGKTRTLDSAATHPVRLAKSSGPNAPASWGSVVRFRFPLPEDVACDGVSFNHDRELLFEGPPCILQVSVYEKKLLHDNALGDADVKIDGLAAGGQLEEWVPLRAEKLGIHWFARIRLTLRFELMCLGATEKSGELAPSVGLRRIQQLSQMGGAHEDIRRSVSTPDLLSYFESMVY